MSALSPGRDVEIRLSGGGDGVPVLFVPGSYSTAAAWRPMQALLPPGRAMATVSLCGYGGTDDPRGDDGGAIEVQTEIVTRAADALGGGPVHLVGHSFGGTVALVAALEGVVKAASMTTFEGNPFMVLKGGPHAPLVAQTLEMAEDFGRAVAAGEPDAAGQIIDFWSGPGSFAALPEPVRDYCRTHAAVNLRDWRSANGLRFDHGRLAALDLPVLLVRGARANPVMVALTETLAGLLPHAECAVVGGADHSLINTHPAETATLLAGFLDRIDGAAPPNDA